MTFITSAFERSVAAPTGAVNGALTQALRGCGFEISNQSLTSIEARRGSKAAMAVFGGFALKKIPIVATVETQPARGGCQVAVRLADEWSVVYGQAGAAKKRYREMFADVQQTLDAALWQLTPSVNGEAAQEWSRKRTGVFMTRLAERMEKVGDHAVREGAAVISGDWRNAKQPWDDVEQVRFESSQGAALLSIIDVQAMLNAGTLIATRPASLPPPLLTELEQLQAHLEHALSGRSGTAIVPLADSETQPLQFLHQQAALRTRFPVRTLQECADCHARKVVNPDYQKILRRNQILKNVGGSFGAGIVKGSISPFVLFSRVMNFAKLDPDFVCRNCQGMVAIESIVALCPQCGAVQSQGVLKACTRCAADFRSSHVGERLWHSRFNGAGRPPLGTPAKWLPDPAGRHEFRYWDGQGWTRHVADDGQTATDPLERTP